jgi:hypothetical protein
MPFEKEKFKVLCHEPFLQVCFCSLSNASNFSLFLSRRQKYRDSFIQIIDMSDDRVIEMVGQNGGVHV